MNRQRKSTYRAGLGAEALARLALRIKGYRILASRYRSKLGEIDIVAARGNTLVFVEVKARPSLAVAAEAISSHQQKRLRNAALDFVARHPKFNDHTWRFDAVWVVPWRWPVHLVNAWEFAD